MKPIIAAYFQVAAWEQRYLKTKLPKARQYFFPGRLRPSHLKKIRSINVLSNFINSPATAQIIDSLPKLKLIATRSTGFDHIDLRAAARRGVIVSNVPFYGENTVAEHTFALLLSISRRIPESIERTHRGSFSPAGLGGFDLKDKTLGIVGTGHIGQLVAKIAYGFGMRLVAFDVFQDKAFAKRYGVTYVSLTSLLKTSDIVSLHAPYNPKTHHLINAQNIKLMKPGAILINTARGGLVDTVALYKALERDRLGGVGLDVLEEENILGEDVSHLSDKRTKGHLATALISARLLDHPRAVITPHNAFNTQEALVRILDTTVENILTWAKGRPMNVVKAK